MSSKVDTPREKSESSGGRSSSSILVPYLIAIGSQLPMLFLYFRNLWDRPHYQVFPLALIALVVFAYLRWPRGTGRKFQSSGLGTFLLICGLGFGLLGFLFVEPWFSAASAATLTASLFARTVDPESQKSLLPVSLFAFFCVQPPFNGDQTLISRLQTISAHFTSQVLDLVGYPHYMPGTVFITPGGKNLEVEQACSGVQSFFSLLFVAILIVVLTRRPWFRALLLLVSATFWAMFMNTVRILAIPLSDKMFGWDLAAGPSHEILGYLTLVVGILLLLSTDQLLFFLFGPVETFGDEGSGTVRRMTRFWNRTISGVRVEGESSRRRRRDLNALTRSMIWVSSILLALGACWNLSDVWRSWQSAGLKVRAFDSRVVVPLAEKDLPATLGTWKMEDKGYFTTTRTKGSDFGQHSDAWNYLADRYRVTVSLDQAFPGWHELTTCYKNQGWIESKASRTTKRPEDSNSPDHDWDFVVCDFKKETGEQMFLVFSHFDAFGEGFDAPRSWDFFTAFTTRALNRLNHRIRSRLFRGEAYQVQAFVGAYGPIDDRVKEEVIANYLLARSALRDQFLKRRNGEVSPPSVSEENPPAETRSDP